VAQQLIAGRSFVGKAGCPPTQPLAEVDAKGLDGAYNEIAVADTRKDCLVCTKKSGRNYRSMSAIVCATCDGKALCLNKSRSFWERWHMQLQY